MLRKKPLSGVPALRTSLVVFLETGDPSQAYAENPFFQMDLPSPAAQEARALWAAGDRVGAVQCLAAVIPLHMLGE